MPDTQSVQGRIHSVETFGALDGPGIRYVVFFQGCPLRCLYCHNPDALCPTDGTVKTAEAVVREIERYTSFIQSGGVTLSGGEPLAQPEFALEILRRCQSMGLHVAVDTSGGVGLEACRPAVEEAALLLLDIKALDDKLCRELTGRSNENALRILDLREQLDRPVWIRHVLVPGYTLDTGRLTELADFLTGYTWVERVELLPFHKMGEYKWETLGRLYLLSHTPAPTAEETAAAKGLFLDRALPVV